AKLLPNKEKILPGVMGAVGPSAVNLAKLAAFNAALDGTDGTATSAATEPVRVSVFSGRGGARERRFTPIDALVDRGTHCPLYWPSRRLFSLSTVASAVKLATIVAVVTLLPQSSFTFTTRLAGQPTGTAKLLVTRPCGVTTWRDGMQSATTGTPG